jgi:Transposase DDE domain group 1
VRLLHSLAKIHATFDDPNLVSRAGLVPVMALAQRAGLGALAGEHVRPAGRCGVNAAAKAGCLVAGMIGGADSIDDMDLLRHGAMPALFGGVRAPSTLGSFLRSFTWGNVLQLGRVNRLLLADLARRAPLLPGKETLAFIDVDSQQKRVYGHKKQGAGFGHTKIQGKSLLVRGLNALAATISTPLAAPVIAATRLRGGSAGSARGAASLARQAVHTARDAGCTGTLVARADSAFYSAAFTGAVRAAGAYFPVTVQMNVHVQAAIAAIGEDAWTPIAVFTDSPFETLISSRGPAPRPRRGGTGARGPDRRPHGSYAIRLVSRQCGLVDPGSAVDPVYGSTLRSIHHEARNHRRKWPCCSPRGACSITRHTLTPRAAAGAWPGTARGTSARPATAGPRRWRNGPAAPPAR